MDLCALMAFMAFIPLLALKAIITLTDVKALMAGTLLKQVNKKSYYFKYF